jgi:hypothetical protein
VNCLKTNMIVISFIVVLGLAVIAASGCDGDNSGTNASTVSTGTVSTLAKTADTQTGTTGALSSGITETADTQPGTSTDSPAGYDTQDVNPIPLQIMAQNASPESVSPGGSVTITCTVKGNASSARVEISKKMDSSFTPVSYPLAKGAMTGDSTTWSANVPAPSVTGLFAFSTYATDGGGMTVKNQLGQGPYDGPGIYFEVL